MSSPGLPTANFPVPPPLFRLPFTVDQNGTVAHLTTPAIGFLTQLWAALQGSGGIIPILIYIPFPAAGSITAYNAVFINGVGQAAAPDLTVIADGQAIIGVAVSTGSVGSNIYVQSFGIVSNSAWTWTDGEPIWCGASGVLTQTVPTGAGNWVRKIGIAVSSTDMMIQIGEVVELT